MGLASLEGAWSRSFAVNMSARGTATCYEPVALTCMLRCSAYVAKLSGSSSGNRVDFAHLDPKAKPNQLDEIMRLIVNTKTRAAPSSGQALQQATELARHRGLVVIISDLFGDMEPIVRALDQLRFKSHEVIVFHLWDLWERRLPVEGNIKFQDMETGEEIQVQADGIRNAYHERVDRWSQEVENECLNRGIQRVELTTNQPMDQALLDYLVKRSKVI